MESPDTLKAGKNAQKVIQGKERIDPKRFLVLLLLKGCRLDPVKTQRREREVATRPIPRCKGIRETGGGRGSVDETQHVPFQVPLF